MRRILGIRLVHGVLLMSILPSPSSGNEARSAPPFELYSLDGSERIRSDELFEAYQHTFLVFWESGCPKCVDHLIECELFADEYAGGDVTVVGINGDRSDPTAVIGILEANGVRFPQYWDEGGAVTRRYGVPYGSFGFTLVGEGSMVESSRIDPAGDLKAVMEQMLLGGDDGEQSSVEATAASRESGAVADTHLGFSFSGIGRIRFLGIDAAGREAVGPYGEAVSPRNGLYYRFQTEMTRPVGRYVRLGGLLRISNEGESVLQTGPQYLGSEWGSAFAEVRVDGLSLRLGYYTISMTPLTLMRWDWDDNPRTGGEAGCGCGDAAGVLLVESLEELGPDLVFEGGVCTYRHADFEARAFYAIPRRAREISKKEVRSTDAEPAHYSLEIYGFSGRWRRYDRRTGSFWRLGVNAVGSWENRRSVDFINLGYPVSDPWYDSFILSITGEAPIIGSLSARGEIIGVNRASSHGIEEATGQDDVRLEGGGGIAGCVFSWEDRMSAACDYLRLDPDFYSPFAALSYEGNTEGMRFSSRIRGLRDIVALSLFYKRLREVESAYADAERERFSLWGATVDMDLPNGFGCSLGYIDRGRWRGGNVEYLDEYRRSFSATTRFLFHRGTYIQAQYQYIRNSVSFGGEPDESNSILYSLYFSTEY